MYTYTYTTQLDTYTVPITQRHKHKHNQSVTEGNTVRITGFGKFTKRHSKERMGRNPSLNEPMLIPPKNRVKFSAYKAFKDSLNE
jgi:nucleoid DNA-binding protein